MTKVSELRNGDITFVETEMGKFIGIFERQDDKYMLFKDTRGTFVTVDKKCSIKVAVKRLDELDKLMCVSNSFFCLILKSRLKEKYGERWLDHVDIFLHPETIRFSSESVKFKLKNGNCEISGGIDLEIDRMGEFYMKNCDVVLRVGDLEAIMDQLVVEVPESIREELGYKEALERVDVLERQIEFYKTALKCSFGLD